MLRPADDHGPLLDRLGKDECVACPRCGYNLHNLRTGRCPECGATVLMWELPDATRPMRWRIAAVDDVGFWVVCLSHAAIMIGIAVSWIAFEREGWITTPLFRGIRSNMPNYMLVVLPIVLELLVWCGLIYEWHIRWFRLQVVAAILALAMVVVHLVALASLWWKRPVFPEPPPLLIR